MIEPRIVHGDARALPLPDASVDLIVTSPPYFGLRDYGHAAQIGAESTPAEYIAALLECTAEMVRVLKPSGSIFVNLGDKYGPNKSLRLLPERYRIACVDELGLIARAVLVWSKPNGLPESVTDRVRRSHEDWVHLTKSPRYFAAVDEIREPYEGKPQRRFTEQPQVGAYAGRNKQTIKGRVWDEPMAGANPLGKLPGSVWEIATQPLRVPAELGVDHFAAFPMEWPRRLILGWSPPGGTVLDPFGGTGTTVLVAAMHGREGISVDASVDYCRLAEWRVNDPKQRERAARPAGARPVRKGKGSAGRPVRVAVARPDQDTPPVGLAVPPEGAEAPRAGDVLRQQRVDGRGVAALAAGQVGGFELGVSGEAGHSLSVARSLRTTVDTDAGQRLAATHADEVAS